MDFRFSLISEFDFHSAVVCSYCYSYGYGCGRYSHMVPACAWASNTIIEASSRLMLVDRCERAAICTSSSNTSSSSSGVRSCELCVCGESGAVCVRD